ncbi:endonuclease-reverse transcriptase [Plakobranchus ocellatus]|uniref:Endonuclease-reverse transcriptase n=1 Tax=Plakobranchus ocellatus TaxID=259542 RepID=A0AAV4C107_9GAST|nr:endonuclease-reverse transcriptase [Plakobranchus ocellatus]
MRISKRQKGQIQTWKRRKRWRKRRRNKRQNEQIIFGVEEDADADLVKVTDSMQSVSMTEIDHIINQAKERSANVSISFNFNDTKSVNISEPKSVNISDTK